jgi:iron-sulfur cluster repair protein YtfE (RIC family)
MLREMFGMADGILQDLHDDHREVSDLIERLLKTPEAGERTALFKELTSKLLAHAHAEQSVVYRKLEKSQDEKARSFALEGVNEHEIVELQLHKMARARNKASEQWTAQLNVLQDLVDHHVEEEEGTGFACIRRDFDRDQLEKLGDQFQREKQKRLAEA